MDKIRLKILEKIYKNGDCHIGSCFSCVEIVLAIKEVMKPGDKFILSKAHAHYVTETIDVPGYVWDLHNFQSLGNGVGIGIGMALANPKNTVYVLCGDGEMDEGSFRESTDYFYHYINTLANLRIIVDYNGFKGLFMSDQVPSYLNVIDGHSIQEIKNCKDNMIIANTIKGKGLPFLENTLESHYKRLNEEEYKECVKILSAN